MTKTRTRIVFRAGKVKIVETLNYSGYKVWTKFVLYGKFSLIWKPKWWCHYHESDPDKKKETDCSRSEALGDLIDTAIEMSRVLTAKDIFKVFDDIINKLEIPKEGNDHVDWKESLNTKLKTAVNQEDYKEAARIKKILELNN